jgi:glycosyltransferase involved in cell wall biosynthesis
MNMSDKVTVLIANKNYGRYIDKAILSALSQTTKPRCICIVDDFSTDNSWDIISGYCTRKQVNEESVMSPNGEIIMKAGIFEDVDILGIRLPASCGPSTARNIGIQVTRASTEFYLILDADDEAMPNKIEELLKPMSNKNVGVSYANYYNINKDTGVKILEIKEPYSQIRLLQECIVHSGSLIRTSTLESVAEENGYYDPNLRTCEDWDLWIRLSKVCMFYHVPLTLTNVLVHSENSTFSVAKSLWEKNWTYIRNKHFGNN